MTTAIPSLENIAAFRQVGGAKKVSGKASASAADSLSLPDWSDDDWREFLKHVDLLPVAPGESLIHRGDVGSHLYFVADGQFEIVLSQIDGMSMGTMVRVAAGSVIGELAFFDGGPRSANVWSTKSSTVLRMSREQFGELESSSPRLAHELVYSLARILAIRLRRATAKSSIGN